MTYGPLAKGTFYLRIDNKNSAADPPGYTIAYYELRRLKENGITVGEIIPFDEHEKHIPNFGRVIVFDNSRILAKINRFDDFLKKIYSWP